MRFMLFAAAFSLVAGCRSFLAPVVEGSPGAGGEAGYVIVLAPGESHVVTLSENATTGFSWVGCSDNPCVAVSVDHVADPGGNADGTPICGAPGEAKVTISASGAFSGSARVVLEYQRPWSKETAQTRVYTVESR